MGGFEIGLWEREGVDVPPNKGKEGGQEQLFHLCGHLLTLTHVSSSPNMKSRFQSKDCLTQALIKHNLESNLFVITLV